MKKANLVKLSPTDSVKADHVMCLIWCPKNMCPVACLPGMVKVNCVGDFDKITAMLNEVSEWAFVKVGQNNVINTKFIAFVKTVEEKGTNGKFKVTRIGIIGNQHMDSDYDLAETTRLLNGEEEKTRVE